MKSTVIALFLCLSLQLGTALGQIGIEARPQKALVKQLAESPEQLLVNWTKQPWEKLFGFYASPESGEKHLVFKEGLIMFIRVEILREGKAVFEAEAPGQTSFPGNILFPGTICFPGTILFPGNILDQLGQGEFALQFSCRFEDPELNEALRVQGKTQFLFRL